MEVASSAVSLWHLHSACVTRAAGCAHHAALPPPPLLCAGTDGCGAPISVLKSVGLADENAFVSPGVATLQQSEAQPPVFSRLYDADGAVVGVPEGELSDAAVSIPANSSTYLGCIEGAACIMDGVVVGRLDGVPTPEECCRRCRASLADGGGQCNVWTHCGVDRQGGCRWAGGGMGGGVLCLQPAARPHAPCPALSQHARTGTALSPPRRCRYESGGIKRQFVSLAPSQCELRFQELAAVTYGWPAALIAKGDGVPFTCGAPLMVWGPEVRAPAARAAAAQPHGAFD